MNQRYFVYMKFDGQDDLSVCIRIFGSKSDKYSNRYTFLDARIWRNEYSSFCIFSVTFYL